MQEIKITSLLKKMEYLTINLTSVVDQFQLIITLLCHSKLDLKIWIFTFFFLTNPS